MEEILFVQKDILSIFFNEAKKKQIVTNYFE